MTFNKENIEKVLMISLLTTFTGQIYISPVYGMFRFSMAVVMLTILLIYFKNVSVMAVCGISAISIPIFRAFVEFVSYTNGTFVDSLHNFYPVAVYYLLYGIIFNLLDIRNKLNNPFLMIISLWVCDSIPNMAEAIFRRVLDNYQFDRLVLNIIVIGLIRSILTYGLFYITMYYKNRYDRKLKESKYNEMVLFISGLKSELFFLKKSMTDIEETMQMSYDLYTEIEDKKVKDRMLTISKNVHEIKKDYARVVNGMERVISSESAGIAMGLNQVFDIIRENSEKIISAKSKNIRLGFRIKEDFKTLDFYPLISVLNNIITNAIDAIEEDGEIIVEEWASDRKYHFSVTDSGAGFEPSDSQVIFEPGYSTKYDAKSGRMSTGLGLSHALQIVEGYFRGDIEAVRLEKERQTCFRISIAKEVIQKGLTE